MNIRFIDQDQLNDLLDNVDRSTKRVVEEVHKESSKLRESINRRKERRMKQSMRYA